MQVSTTYTRQVYNSTFLCQEIYDEQEIFLGYLRYSFNAHLNKPSLLKILANMYDIAPGI